MKKPYFILLDKLSHNLEEKIKTWRSASIENRVNKKSTFGHDGSGERSFLLSRLDILFDVASALKYLHSKQITHLYTVVDKLMRAK